MRQNNDVRTLSMAIRESFEHSERLDPRKGPSQSLNSNPNLTLIPNQVLTLILL
jgi:hypothetical protein